MSRQNLTLGCYKLIFWFLLLNLPISSCYIKTSLYYCYKVFLSYIPPSGALMFLGDSTGLMQEYMAKNRKHTWENTQDT